MKRLVTVCIVSALGISSVASAQNLLINAGAEDGDLSGWSTDSGTPAAMADCGFAVYPSVDTGDFSFSMDQCDAVAGDFEGAAQISQEVDTTGCNVTTSLGELTGGTYDLSTRYSVTDGDQATLSVVFEDIYGTPLEGTAISKSAPDSAFYDASIAGPIPAGASTAVVSLGGVAVGDLNPGAYHDNAEYKFDACIAAYAVTAGKTTCTGGNESAGGGDGNGEFEIISECDGKNGLKYFKMDFGARGTIMFDGGFFVEAQIGLMDETGTVDGEGTPETFPYVGQITADSYVLFKAKQPKTVAWCLFTPLPVDGTSAMITDSYWYFTSASYIHCESVDGTVVDGTWPFPLAAMNPVGADNGKGGKGRDKDRGSFWIGAMDFPLVRGNSGTYEN